MKLFSWDKQHDSLPIYSAGAYRDTDAGRQEYDKEKTPMIHEKEIVVEQHETPAITRRTFLINALCVLINTACTVLVVFANKSVFSHPQLRNFQVTTAAYHFAVTSIVLRLASLRPFNMFTARFVHPVKVLPVSLLFIGFLLFGNLSLAMNPVAFYQIAKILTTPAVVAINFVVFRKTLSLPLLAAVAVSCIGVMLTVGDAALSNYTGTIIAVGAFMTTAFYQIWIGKKITDLDLSPPQLLLNQALLATVLLLCIAPYTDTRPDVSSLDSRTIITFLLSGLLAAGLNLSQFLIIGRTSALTFNMVSNAKNIIIIAGGWYQAGKMLGVMDVFGVGLALGGATAYSILLKASKPK